MAEILDFRNDRLNVSGGYRERCGDGGACTSCCSSRQRGCLSVTEWNQQHPARDTAGWTITGYIKRRAARPRRNGSWMPGEGGQGGDGDRQQRVTWSDLALAGDDSPPLSLLSMCRALSKQIVGYWKILNGSFYSRVRGTTLELQLSSCACFLCHFEVS